MNEKELKEIFSKIRKAPERTLWLSDERRPDSDVPPVQIPENLKHNENSASSEETSSEETSSEKSE